MGEIRIVGPGKTRGYPYPECKKRVYFVILVSEISRADCIFQLLYFCISLWHTDDRTKGNK